MLAIAAYRCEDDIQGFDTTGDRGKTKPVRECLSKGLFCSLNLVLLTAVSLLFLLLLGLLASGRMAVDVCIYGISICCALPLPLWFISFPLPPYFSPRRRNWYLFFPGSDGIQRVWECDSSNISILGCSGLGAGEKKRGGMQTFPCFR